MKKRFIKIPIFNQRIWFATKEHAEKYSGCGDVSLYAALCYRDDEEVIFFYHNNKLSDDLLVHESVHLANLIIINCLVYSTPEQDEILAYLSAYIYKFIKREIDNKIK